MNKKLESVIIILLIAAAVIPVYSIVKYFQKIIRPRESFGRLALFTIACLAIIFVVTFSIVFIIPFILFF